MKGLTIMTSFTIRLDDDDRAHAPGTQWLASVIEGDMTADGQYGSSAADALRALADELDRVGVGQPGYYEIQSSDVGKPRIEAFGRKWPVADFLGTVQRIDVGKRVYRRGDHVTVESSAQLRARRNA